MSVNFQNSFIAPYLILTVVVIICNEKRVSQERFENFFKKNELKSYDPLNQEPNCTFLWVVVALNFNLFCWGVLFYEGLVVFFLEMGITERFYLLVCLHWRIRCVYIVMVLNQRRFYALFVSSIIFPVSRFPINPTSLSVTFCIGPRKRSGLGII